MKVHPLCLFWRTPLPFITHIAKVPRVFSINLIAKIARFLPYFLHKSDKSTLFSWLQYLSRYLSFSFLGTSPLFLNNYRYLLMFLTWSVKIRLFYATTMLSWTPWDTFEDLECCFCTHICKGKKHFQTRQNRPDFSVFCLISFLLQDFV